VLSAEITNEKMAFLLQEPMRRCVSQREPMKSRGLLAAHLNGEHLVAEGAFDVLAPALKVFRNKS